jgi:hypothetical protein
MEGREPLGALATSAIAASKFSSGTFQHFFVPSHRPPRALSCSFTGKVLPVTAFMALSLRRACAALLFEGT